MRKNAPWGDKCTVRIQSLDFVAVKAEAHGLKVNVADGSDYTIHEEHIPLNDLETLNAPSPNRRVPDPNMARPFNKPVRHGPVVEVGRWARPGVESATSGLDLCCVRRDSRAAVPPGKVEERVTPER